MVTDALSWWRAALADALAQGEPWGNRRPIAIITVIIIVTTTTITTTFIV